jgi:hypothetical protein
MHTPVGGVLQQCRANCPLLLFSSPDEGIFLIVFSLADPTFQQILLLKNISTGCAGSERCAGWWLQPGVVIAWWLQTCTGAVVSAAAGGNLL